mgnify:CR=1 FL=1
MCTIFIMCGVPGHMDRHKKRGGIMTTYVTKEQFECAVNFVKNHSGDNALEYMDDTEKTSYELAIEHITKYRQQIAEYKNAQKTL